MDVLMDHWPKPAVVTDGNNLIGIEFTWGKTILFGSLEFIANHFNNLSFSPEGNDLGTVFMGMVHSRSPSLDTIFEDSTSEDDLASSDGGSPNFPLSQGCNVVTPTIPIITTPSLKGTPMPQTIPTVPLWTIMLQSDTKLLPKRLRVNQEEHQRVLQADAKRRAAQ
jgi:hypothetical protein